ncbi:triose-phosphate transporter family-domain-containing protein [Geopyxis carbonaria]|nr:triose-phosphate transporter family-domain-containing protein [Geopyxis carbonaria]
MCTNFPAPTLSNPPSSSSEDDFRPRQTLHLHSRHPNLAARRLHPPTPSSGSYSAEEIIAAPSGRSRNFFQIDRTLECAHRQKITHPGNTALRILRAPDFEEHEMDGYIPDDEELGLSSSDRRRHRQQTARGVHQPILDEAEESLLASDSRHIDFSKDDKTQADRKVIRDLAINLLLIGLWYLFSLLISVYNKWMFSKEHLDFHFPLFVTCLHMIVQFILSSLVLFAFPKLRPAGLYAAKIPADVTGPQEPVNTNSESYFRWNNRAEESKKQKEGVMTNWMYLTKIAPCGAATGLDIGLGNMSLKFITLTFYTMCKSSSLAFVLIFAFAFRLEKVTWKLVGIISIMTAGVVMMVASEAKFVFTGFILVITASALSGVRWSLTQLLLLQNPATSNPFSSIFYLAPCMFVAILVIAIPVEGFGPLFDGFGQLVDKKGFFASIVIIIFPGVVAFLMVSSEFALLKRSSVVTLSICGIFKEVMTISAAAILFGDPLTPVNISGLFVTIISIAAYNYIKIKKMREEAALQAVGKSTSRSNTGYAAVDDEDFDNEDIDRLGDGVSNTIPTSTESDTDMSDIRVGESAISPGARFSFDNPSIEGSGSAVKRRDAEENLL